MAADFVQANGISVCYETFGSPDDPALLLVMGFGSQLIQWEPEFCLDFVREGFYVIRYDNRDVGLSTWFDGSTPDVEAISRGDLSTVAYTLYDMADDAVGVLDALGIRAAHLLGASMGGMIAQIVAAAHPERVLSLCSIMSTTGSSEVGGSSRRAREAMLLPRPATREGTVTAAVETSRALCGGGFPFDEALARRRAEAAYDRAHHPEGRLRQQAAIMATGNRTELLHQVQAPTVVIHGDSDPLVHMSGGEATARAIEGARLVIVPGLGHELPVGVRPRVVDEFARNARRAAPSAVE